MQVEKAGWCKTSAASGAGKGRRSIGGLSSGVWETPVKDRSQAGRWLPALYGIGICLLLPVCGAQQAAFLTVF